MRPAAPLPDSCTSLAGSFSGDVEFEDTGLIEALTDMEPRRLRGRECALGVSPWAVTDAYVIPAGDASTLTRGRLISATICLSCFETSRWTIGRLDIEGQINGVKKMITDRRYCPEIIMQLKAVRSACQSIESILLESHLNSCVVDAFNTSDSAVKEEKIKELTKLFKK